MKRTYSKMLIRGVGNSLNRFFSITAIVALGVGFLAGLLSTSPDMEYTLDNYYDEYNMADMTVKGTLGLTDDDADALRSSGLTELVMPFKSMDLIMSLSDNENFVTRLSGINLADSDSDEFIGKFELTDGRLPQNSSECLLEIPDGYKKNHKIGEIFRVSEENADYEDIGDTLAVTEYTVVGIAESPSYISIEAERTNVGDGEIALAIYTDISAFSLDVYTDIAMTLNGARSLNSFDSEYVDLLDETEPKLKEMGLERSKLRYDEVITEANDKLDDAQAEYNDSKLDAEQKLVDARKKLDDAKTELADGKKKLADGEIKISDAEREIEENRKKITDGEREIADNQKIISDGEREIADNQKIISDGEREIADNQKKITDGEREIAVNRKKIEDGDKEIADNQKLLDDNAKKIADSEKQIADNEKILNDGKAQLDDAQNTIDEKLLELDAAYAQWKAGSDKYKTAVESMGGVIPPEYAETFAAQKAALDAAYAKIAAGRRELDYASGELQKKRAEITVGEAELADGKKQLADAKIQLADGQAKITDAKKESADGKAKLAEAQAEIDDGKVQLSNAKAEIADGKAQLNTARADIEDGKKQIAEAQAKIDDGKIQLTDGQKKLDNAKAEIADNKTKITDGEKEVADGEKEYSDGVIEMNEKLSDAQKKIDDARKDVRDIENPKWIVLSRSDNIGFSGYKSNVQKVDAIARVFPIFFFLVAALVALTTMTRMVEEERLQIGTLRALGYSRGTVMFYYVGYSMLASLLGSIIGVLIGSKLLPVVIANAYSMMYRLPKTLTPFRLEYAVIITGVAVACTSLATFFSCHTTMTERPAALMQARAPKAGKRVFLDRIPFIWNHMGFIHKVTARNLFRYKKRFYMTVLGIAGCCALLLTGFGLRDSISDIVDKQFGEIYQYNLLINLDSDGAAQSDSLLSEYLSDPAIINAWGTFSSENGYVEKGTESKAVTINVPESTDDLKKFFSLRERITHKDIPFSDDSAILTEKLCETLGISIGDSFTIKNADDKEATLVCTGITENYVAAFCYISKPAYERAFGTIPEFKTVFANSTADTPELRSSASSKLLESDEVVYVMFSDTIRSSFVNMLKNINYIVMVLILAAGALAVIVLYNLININICERKKELATIKVLGFYNGEVASYVYRETIILCIIGTLVGLVLGILLHQFVIRTAEVDAVMFGRLIKPMSYVISAVLTMIFSVIVNLLMLGKLKAINMVESMKAND